jgi:hypothetical protein
VKLLKNMSKLTFTEISKSNIEVSFNKINLGSLICIEDGFFYWFTPNFKGTCIANWALIQIIDKINELNMEYKKSLDEYFSNI